MKRWVVTGPAGAGKSALCGMLARRGAAVLDGDGLGHEVLRRPEVVSVIEREFGSAVVADKVVDRAALGAVVFGDPAALGRLNRITHGPLSALAARRLDELEKAGRHGLAVLEAAVYFLLPAVPGIDLVVTVTATEATRLARLTRAGGLDPEAALARIRAQHGLEPGWAGADVVLSNDGDREELEAAAAGLWSLIGD